MNHFSDLIQLTDMGAEALYGLSRVLAETNEKQRLEADPKDFRHNVRMKTSEDTLPD